MRLAAFIMTFEREQILDDTIQKLLGQSLPPEEILIVDNSLSKRTFKLFENNTNPIITYHRMGYNAGPSGAAYYGLKKLTEKGYDWIFWGDDDDPPRENDSLEKLLRLVETENGVGIIGGLGGKFFPNRVRTRNFYNKEMCGVVEADYVAGGQMLIVNSKVVKQGILPTKKLFFGFEELDFCLKVKAKGFKIIFDGDEVKMKRELNGNINPNYKWKNSSFGDPKKVWRDYHSIRNMLYILKKRNFYFGYCFFLIKNLIKIPFSFKYGRKYGVEVAKYYSKAIWHHFNGRYGYHN